MKDPDFKKLKHSCKEYEIILKGGELAEGYKPDIVMQRKQEYIILESEHSSSRKHILGGMIKAARFLSNEKKGTLVIVIQIKKNTKVVQIQKHLNPYLDWVKNSTNLRDVYVISDTDYCKSTMDNPVELLNNKFKQLASKV